MKSRALVMWLLLAALCRAAGYQTANFIVTAPTPQLAKEIGDAAEHWRKELARYWLGKEMPTWAQPCKVHVMIARGAGGATTMVFENGEVFGWDMNIQGDRKALLSSVLPHEVSHTVLASHFRKPIPRWADEGACSSIESPEELARLETRLTHYLRTGRGVPTSTLLQISQYPDDPLSFYAQGCSLARFLIGRSSPQAFIAFLGDAMQDCNWRRAVKSHYGYDSITELQTAWLQWRRAGQPVAHTVAFNGYCINGQCYGGNCSPGLGVGAGVYVGPPVYVRPQPVRPQPQYVAPRPQPPLRPIEPPTSPPVADINPDPPPTPEPTIDKEAWDEWKAEQDALAEKTKAEIRAEISVLIQRIDEIKSCHCDPNAIASLNAQLSALAVQVGSMEKLPTYDELADKVIARLDHPTPIRVYDPSGRLIGESTTNIFRPGGSIDFTFNPRALLDKSAQ